MLMARTAAGRIGADAARRDDAHQCPGCGGAVTLKRGRVVTPHFAHRADARCVWAAGESATHLAAKRGLSAALAARGLEVELEAELLSDEGDRRADVLARHPVTGVRVAIEVQHSALAVEEIARRTRAYAAAGVAVIWVATLDVARSSARAVGYGARAIDRYAVPDWQRWAAAYHGALWFWDDGRLWRGWLGEGWVAASNIEREGGLDWRPSKRWAGLTLEGPFDPTGVLLRRRAHLTEPHESLPIPAGWAANFVLAGESTIPAAPAETAWRAENGRVAPQWVARARDPRSPLAASTRAMPGANRVAA